MKLQTEMAVRNLVALDAEVSPENVERALDVLRGKPTGEEDLVHVLRRKDVMDLLHIKRRTLDYYIKRGYLDRVYAGRERALGVSRESYQRFIRLGLTRREGSAA